MSTRIMVLDRRCEFPLKAGYLLAASCRNCAERHVALFSKGQEALPAQEDEHCPHCGCSKKLFYTGTRDALLLLQDDLTPRLYVEDPRQGLILTRETLELLPLVPDFALQADKEKRSTSLPTGAGIYDMPPPPFSPE